MSTAAPARGRVALGLVLAVCAVIWLAFLRHTSMIYEDALITYRYAENLALGNGFVYNAGERVLGTTTPLFTMLLAAAAALFGTARIPLISNVLMLLAALGSQWLLYATLVRAGAGTVAALAALFVVAVHPAFLWATGSGMETPLVVFFMAASLHAAVHERWSRAMFACGLLVLTRIDGIVWAAVIAATMVARLRAAAWRPLIPALAVTAPWFLFSWIYFGSVLPHSVLAKLEIRPNAGHVDYGAWFAGAMWLNQPLRGLTVAFAAWCVFVAAGAVTVATPRGRPLAPLVLFPVLFMGFMWLGHAPMFQWYLTPAAWCVAVLAALGAARWFAAPPWLSAPSGRRIGQVLVALLAVSILFAVVRRDLRMADYARIEQANETGLRRHVGEWLAQRMPPDARIAMEAVGYQGTFARRRIIDLAGLISPEVVRIRRGSASNADAFDRILRELRPDAIVLRAFEVEANRHAHGGRLFETPARRDSFLAHHVVAGRFIAPYPRIWGENAALTVWERVR